MDVQIPTRRYGIARDLVAQQGPAHPLNNSTVVGCPAITHNTRRSLFQMCSMHVGISIIFITTCQSRWYTDRTEGRTSIRSKYASMLGQGRRLICWIFVH